MPLYAYHCSSCEKAFRIYHKSTEIQVECINCKSDAIEKIIPQVRTVESKKNTDDPKARIEKFIEESRETLKEQKAEATREMK